MAFGKIVWMMGGAGGVLVASALGVAACSSSSGGSSPQDSGTSAMETSTAEDSGTTPVSDGGTATDTSTSTGEDSGTTGGGDSGGTCEKPPKTFPETTPGVYCPFSASDGGGNVTCAPGQHCCETPASANTPSTCVADGTPCPVTGSVDWQCEAPIDCMALDAATPVCCGTGTQTSASSCGQTWTEWNGFTGTQCMAACPAPGITVCEQASDCTTDAGSTCTASKSNGNDFGYCN